MNDNAFAVWWRIALSTLGHISYPFGVLLYYIGTSLLFIASLLYRPIVTFLQPFIYIGRFVLFIVTLPYYLLVTFEPLYNFLGVAAIVGILIGLSLHYSSRQFDAVPDINDYLPWLQGRTVKGYRQAKLKDKGIGHASLPSSGYASMSDSFLTSQRRKRNLQSQIILEEVDSDY